MTIELMMSPILGLMMVIINLFMPTGLVEGKTGFERTGDSQVWGYFYGFSRLFYKVSLKSHPP